MMRLFVGLALPEAVRDDLGRLCAGLPGARWIDPDMMHVTLRFIGEVDELDAEDIHHQLARVRAPRFEITLGGLDTFGQGRKTRALWVRVARSDDLLLLQGRVDSAVVRAGQPPEPRKFVPHVTLARFREAPAERMAAFIAANNLFRARPCAIEQFTLFESATGAGGAVYTALQDYPLGPR
jgi:2'-5' RNA ligase